MGQGGFAVSQIHLWTSTLLWLLELLALLQLQESLVSARICKRKTMPKICKYAIAYNHMRLTTAACSTPIQQKIYGEDFKAIVNHLPFLRIRLESNVPSQFLRKVIN